MIGIELENLDDVERLAAMMEAPILRIYVEDGGTVEPERAA